MNMRFSTFTATGALVGNKQNFPSDEQLVAAMDSHFAGLRVTEEYLPGHNLRAGAVEEVPVRDNIIKLWILEDEKLVCYVFLGDNPRGIPHEFECIAYGVYRDNPMPGQKMKVVRLIDGPTGNA